MSTPAPFARGVSEQVRLIHSAPVKSEFPAMRGIPRVRRFFRDMEHFRKVLAASGGKSAAWLVAAGGCHGEYARLLEQAYSRNLWNRGTMVSCGLKYAGGRFVAFEKPGSESPHMRSDVHAYLAFVEKAMRILTLGRLGCPRKLVGRAEQACKAMHGIQDALRPPIR